MTPRDAVKAGLWTAVFSFATLFSVSLLGFLGDVLAWAQAAPGTVVVFPDPSVLAKAAVAALVAAAIGLVNTLVRLVQARLGLGSGPSYRSVPPAK